MSRIGHRLLNAVERGGNRLPDPVMLFLWLCLIVMLASALAAWAGLSGINPSSGEKVAAVNLFSPEMLRKLFTEMPKTLTGFAPLGTVLVVMMGVGVAEKSGLIGIALSALVRAVKRGWLLTAVIVFAGVNSSLAADAGYVVLVPLAGAVFAAAGRHPVAGISAAFAGVSGGFSANLLITPLDPLLAGITQTAAAMVNPDYVVSIPGNLFLMQALVPMLTLIGTLVCTFVVEPRLGPWSNPNALPVAVDETTPQQARGLRYAGWMALAILAALLALAGWPGAPLRDPAAATLVDALVPFFNSLVALTGIAFLLLGLAYGKGSGTITSQAKAIDMVADSMRDMALYIVLAFAAAHFIALFAWSNLGTIVAISGAQGLQAIGVNGSPLLLSLIVITALINLFVASASAKWAILATIFVPMSMLVGITPEATQAAYRLGDSATNIITPVMPYFPLVLVAARRYLPDFGIGSMVALMLPYSLAILVGSLLLFAAWLALGIPLGPGTATWL
jgi:aminobenzoyl-glutamate transport protein